MNDWTLSRDGAIVAMRRFISAGPVTRPPTDEDSALVREGDDTVFTTWVDGTLSSERNPEDIDIETASVAGSLRAAYASGDLVEDGRDAQGNLRLRAKSGACDGRAGVDFAADVERVSVDPETFLPVRLEEMSSCSDTGEVNDRRVITVESRSTSPATPESLKDLEIGDWPYGPDVPVG